MKMGSLQIRKRLGIARCLLTLFLALILIPGNPGLYALPSPQAGQPGQEAPKLSNDELDSLVAPIALYPDQLLAQMLAASTYPLEVVQLQQWSLKHKDLKDKALADAVEKEKWDASVQAMAAVPDAVKQLAENIKWTTDLGNAFLAQQADVMDAVQRMRTKAQGAGTLKSTEQQKVETKVVESKTVVVIEPTNPQVVYVPSYNPVVVYGPPVYPYPPIYYPPAGAYVATAAISFGVGMAMGAAWGGGWGWGCGWGGNNITINNNNNFISNSNRVNQYNGGNRNNINGGNRGNTWQHNPQHRGGAPYSNQATANRFGGTTRGASGATRQNQGQLGSRQQPATANRGAATNRQQTGATNRGSSGADRVGNRSVPSGTSSRGADAFGGGSGGGFSGSSARASSSRGASSMGSRAGGGRRR